jgi:DeoD family purine-nucleoside phosphorylase
VPGHPIHIHPTAPLAPRALLPGDPGRALALAQALLEEPRMFNHNRGLWGYTGTARDGRPLTIQSTGMGGPSAAIVVEELCDLGLEAAVRVGTCGALDGSLGLGDVIAADEVLATDGTSRALGASARIAPDAGLTAGLAARAGRAGLVVSTDLFYERDASRARAWVEAGAVAVEMEAATVLAVAARRAIRAACVLAVSDVLGPDGKQRERLDADALTDAGLRLGRLAAAVLEEP